MIRSLSMIAFSLTNIKDFMSHLLLNETFDHFSFIEGEITTFNTFHIDGFIKKEFFDSNSVLPEYSYWKNVRNFCFFPHQRKRTPLAFQFVFSLCSEEHRNAPLAKRSFRSGGRCAGTLSEHPLQRRNIDMYYRNFLQDFYDG